MHIPVLLKEAVEGLALKPGNTVIDATLGEGSHSKALCEIVGPNGRVIGIDQDAESITRAKKTMSGAICTFVAVEENFSHIDSVAAEHAPGGVQGILMDLGWNSGQFETSGRGFSFAKDEPLIMTFAARPGEGELTAYEIINSWNEEDIAKVIFEYGEERFSRRIARRIMVERKRKPIVTTAELAEIISSTIPRGKTNPATKTFQALRIAVNDELNVLKMGLERATELLVPGGRLAVISFHSLEDRIVKQYFKAKEDEEILERITKKPLIASGEELKSNPRARSAKLRIAEKL